MLRIAGYDLFRTGIIEYLRGIRPSLFFKRAQVPRDWGEYSAREYLRIRPLVDRYKHARYQRVMRQHVRVPGPVEAVAAMRGLLPGRDVLVTIAFNDPQVIAWQSQTIRANIPHALWIVADNSTDDAAARSIRAVAERDGVPYIRLPRGPWTTAADGGKSHGLALTWMWRHVLQPGRPRAFGFLDHDIFPMRPTDPFAMLTTYPVAGKLIGWGAYRWFLWAGFCFYDFAAVQTRDLNFSRDWLGGLDTGGCNWPVLYRDLDRNLLPPCPIRFETVPGCISEVEWIGGDWLHESNFTTSVDLKPEERADIRKRKRAYVAGLIGQALAKIVEIPPRAPAG